MCLAGRDENGFVEGSEAQADYLRAIAVGPEGGEGDAHREARRGQRAEAKRKKREVTYRQALLVPEWWGETFAPVKGRNARYLARQKAIRAAFELGVDVPEWVRERALPTREDVDRIRQASLDRYEHPVESA